MDPEVCFAGSLPGDEHQVGSSFRGWRIDGARKDSEMEDLVQTGYQDEEGRRTHQAFADELKLRVAAGKVRESSQG
jgi:hypothetical protein